MEFVNPNSLVDDFGVILPALEDGLVITCSDSEWILGEFILMMLFLFDLIVLIKY